MAIAVRNLTKVYGTEKAVDDISFDVKTGETLWQTKLGTTVMGYPVTFSVGGRQYIAVSTGGGSLSKMLSMPARTSMP